MQEAKMLTNHAHGCRSAVVSRRALVPSVAPLPRHPAVPSPWRHPGHTAICASGSNGNGNGTTSSRVTTTTTKGKVVALRLGKERYIPLPDTDTQNSSLVLPSLPSDIDSDSESLSDRLRAGLESFDDMPDDVMELSGRITFYGIAESFDRPFLMEYLKETYPDRRVKNYPGVLYLQYNKGKDDEASADVYLFDQGVVACWGLSMQEEAALVNALPQACQLQRLSPEEVEVENLRYNFTAVEQSHVQNDIVTLHRRYAQNHKMKLAISYALAQATKLSVYEKRVAGMVAETQGLPEELAQHGEVGLSGKDIARLIGKVFLQKRAVNLLSQVLDTPEFFWHAPDRYQALYERVVEYLELRGRVEVLNTRFGVMQEMLDMLRNYQSDHHNSRLEWIVIWLIAVEIVLGCFELAEMFGMAGKGAIM